MIRTVTTDDAARVHSAIAGSIGTYKWEFGGCSRNPDAIRRLLWVGVLVPGVVIGEGRVPRSRRSATAHLQNGHAKVSLLLAEAGRAAIYARAAPAHRLRRPVRDFPLRKLYVEMKWPVGEEHGGWTGWDHDVSC